MASQLQCSRYKLSQTNGKPSISQRFLQARLSTFIEHHTNLSRPGVQSIEINTGNTISHLLDRSL